MGQNEADILATYLLRYGSLTETYVGIQTWRSATKNTLGCEKLRYVAHTNVTQRNTWIKSNVANPTTWHIEKYAT